MAELINTRVAYGKALVELGHSNPDLCRRCTAPATPARPPTWSWAAPRWCATGSDLAIVATGVMVARAVAAAEQLAGDGVRCRVIDLHTIKPLDADTLAAAARETRAIVTAEEHNVIGGLGGAVAEALAETCPVPP